MHSAMDKVTTTSLGTIVDNVNKKYVLNNEEYIMLIKEQPNKVCLLYVTDCEANFWQKVLDILFFEELRNELHLNSDVNTLVKHFVASLKINSSLEKGKTVRQIRINIVLAVGEGITMNCSVKVENRVNIENNLEEFKPTLRRFFKQLFEAKQAQIVEEKGKNEEQKKAFEQQKRKQEKVHDLKMSFQKDQAKPNIRKNRNLMNPDKKKRKSNGAKFTQGQEQCQ